MTAFSRLAAAVVASTLLNSVLVAIPVAAAPSDAGLEVVGARNHDSKIAARHGAVAKAHKVKKAKRNGKKRVTRGKTSVCGASAAATTTALTTTTTSSTSTADAGATSSSSTTAAAATTPPATPPPTSVAPPGGCKLGLAWNDADRADINQFPGACWYYTWSPWDVPTAQGMQHVPMSWGPKHNSIFNERFNGQEYILAGNEMDEPSQGNMSPGDTFAWWMSEIVWRPTKKIGPAVTNGERGLNWMTEFLAICNGACDLSGVAIHFYGTRASDFIAYANTMHQLTGLPLWVTEIACHNFGGGNAYCSQEETDAFMYETVTFMKNTPWIHRFSWFGTLTDMFNVGETNRMMDGGGHITPFGYKVLEASR